MQTYSHLLINGALSIPLKRRGCDVNTPAFLLGALLPDIPFFLLTVLGSVYYTWLSPVPTGESPLLYMHMTLYFTDPLWLIGHNMFHAPIILVVLGLIGFWRMRSGRSRAAAWGDVVLWFALGAGLHTVIDVVTHAGDGPLLLFPLSWTYRFQSPISYWDPQHYGLLFTPVEHVLDVVLLVYVLVIWRRTRTRNVAATH